MADKREMLANALLQEPATIKNTPRSHPSIGMIAELLRPWAEDSENIHIGKESLGERLGLPKTQAMLEDISYGKPYFSGGSLQTATPDPRTKDALNLLSTFAPAKLFGLGK